MAHTKGVGLQQVFGGWCLEVDAGELLRTPKGVPAPGGAQNTDRWRPQKAAQSRAVVGILKAATEQWQASIGGLMKLEPAVVSQKWAEEQTQACFGSEDSFWETHGILSIAVT